MVNRIVHVHGGGAQPAEQQWQKLWQEALRSGLLRDHPTAAPLFDALEHEFVYYADLVSAETPSIDEELDARDRRLALNSLQALRKTKDFRRVNYERLAGKSSMKEFVVDLASPVLRLFGLGKYSISRVVPELAAYWREGHPAATGIDQRLLQALRVALSGGGEVCIVSHGVGTVFVYNALWQLSHDNAPVDDAGLTGKVGLWLTLGSPLADDTVRRALAGAAEDAARRYPTNIVRWHNLAAEDDFLCHDETMANDFAPLLRERRIAEIVDHRIYNLAVRYGSSAPGHSAGYLIHPRTSSLLADWCTAATSGKQTSGPLDK